MLASLWLLISLSLALISALYRAFLYIPTLLQLCFGPTHYVCFLPLHLSRFSLYNFLPFSLYGTLRACSQSWSIIAPAPVDGSIFLSTTEVAALYTATAGSLGTNHHWPYSDFPCKFTVAHGNVSKLTVKFLAHVWMKWVLDKQGHSFASRLNYPACDSKSPAYCTYRIFYKHCNLVDEGIPWSHARRLTIMCLLSKECGICLDPCILNAYLMLKQFCCMNNYKISSTAILLHLINEMKNWTVKIWRETTLRETVAFEIIIYCSLN